MISLSTRAKEAIKTGLAMVIVFAIAFLFGWDKPEWAGLAVAAQLAYDRSVIEQRCQADRGHGVGGCGWVNLP